MKKMFAMVLVFLLLLSGCGKDGTRKIVAFGDSNTRGSNWQFREYPKAEKWVNLLQTSLRGKYSIVNAGIGGETTEDARFRFRKDVLDKHPAYLLIMFGTNDAAILAKGVPRVSKKRFRENLSYFVKESRRHGIKPVLMTCLPLVEGSGNNIFYYSRYRAASFEKYGGARKWHDSYNEVTRKTARKLDVPLIDNWKSIVDKAGGQTDEHLIKSGYIDPSGNHLTPKGARIIFEDIKKSGVIKTS
ncbi:MULTISPECIES: SGNH/GDSL hydrolase family protein [Bacillus]|uniref:SGNH/GDSL hydrolase family protein n=1 Tax=Bacillus TaxID=1386 RepID=UPI00040F596E|nr:MULTISPECIES: SGNH/GDSL hydrolase family protein [Bacillus]QHZ47746.1 SGNH/GDSL hydrolase family protein [Bacillus sp. NSP9.1]WFA03800.1 GDSL-type esterase/lipase family protein [Bacillus sp. HSf4]